MPYHTPIKLHAADVKHLKNKKRMPGARVAAKFPPPHTSRIRAPVAELTLRELEALASTGLTGFLTLFHAAVTSKAASLLKSSASRLISENESASETVTNRTSLTGDTAAFSERYDIDLRHIEASDSDRLLEVITESLRRNVIVKSDLINGPNASTFNEVDASSRGFATASSGSNCFLGSHFKLSP
jgi:hypothetical protein